MDESLLEQFQSSIGVSRDVNDTSAPHPYYALYKARREGYGSQEARRRTFMEDQKARRRNLADMARKIADGSDLSEEESEGEVDQNNMEVVDEKKVRDTWL